MIRRYLTIGMNYLALADKGVAAGIPVPKIEDLGAIENTIVKQA